MSELPFWSQILILMFLLVLSAFFSISETSLMAVNRYRMRHLAENGNRGAKQVLALLKQELERDMKLMGVRSIRELSRKNLRDRRTFK